MTRVLHVGTRATIWCGCMRKSVVELIGRLETIALGKRSIFARAFPTILGGAPGPQACLFAQILSSNAMYRSAAIRLKGEGK